MKHIINSVFIISLFSTCLTGCGEKSSAKTETEITTPGGKTTITTEKEVKQSGQNPPAARP